MLRSGSVSGPGSGSGRSGLLRVSAVGSGVVLVTGGRRDWGDLGVGWDVGHWHRLHCSVQRVPRGKRIIQVFEMPVRVPRL